MLVGHLLKTKKIETFNEIGDSRYIYQNKLDRACIQHNMANCNFKDLPRRIASDKVLHDKAFNVAKKSRT